MRQSVRCVLLTTVFGLVCSPCTFAAEGEFQHELSINLTAASFGDVGKTIRESVNYSYYFHSISSGDYPLNEAAFVAHDSRIFCGTGLAVTDNEYELRETSIGAGAEFESASWPVGILISYASYDSSYDYVGPYDFHSVTKTLFGRLAVYLAPTAQITLSKLSGDTNTDSSWAADSNYERNAVGFRTLFAMGSRMFGVLNVGASKYSRDRGQNHFESKEHREDFVWYPTRELDLVVGAGGVTGNDVGSNDSNYRWLAVGWYVTPKLKLGASLRSDTVDDGTVERSTSISADLRF